ncbi:hypothetical protein GGR56DRAFT_695779 [Xylariaceae sp. FL0804]|nr:hypothetical protein GGR56DRAFT_695779 [Xylariaceae sp. FL0804]
MSPLTANNIFHYLGSQTLDNSSSSDLGSSQSSAASSSQSEPLSSDGVQSITGSEEHGQIKESSAISDGGSAQNTNIPPATRYIAPHRRQIGSTPASEEETRAGNVVFPSHREDSALTQAPHSTCGEFDFRPPGPQFSLPLAPHAPPRDLDSPWRHRPHPQPAGGLVSSLPVVDRRRHSVAIPPRTHAVPCANYRGDPTNPRNQSAAIPDAANCSTYWTGLPPTCDYGLLLGSLRGVGGDGVAHCALAGPDLALGGKHAHAAAKVEFYTPDAAARVLAQAASGRLLVGGLRPRVARNRIRVAALDVLPQPQVTAAAGWMGIGRPPSRVILIAGPAAVVARPVLEALWSRAGLAFDLEAVLLLAEEDGGRGARGGGSGGNNNNNNNRCLEYRFASYRTQAGRAWRILRERVEGARRRRGEEEEDPVEGEEEKKDEEEEECSPLWGEVLMLWGTDPCA